MQAHFPLGGQLGAVTLGYRFHIGFQCGKELCEVGQRVTYHRTRAGHRVLGADAVAVNDLHDVVGRATLRETAESVHPHVVFGTVHIVLICDKHLAQVIHLARLAQ